MTLELPAGSFVNLIGTESQVSLSVCPILLPFPPIQRCWSQQHSLTDVLHANVCINVCFLGKLNCNRVSIQSYILNQILYTHMHTCTTTTHTFICWLMGKKRFRPLFPYAFYCTSWARVVLLWIIKCRDNWLSTIQEL